MTSSNIPMYLNSLKYGNEEEENVEKELLNLKTDNGKECVLMVEKGIIYDIMSVIILSTKKSNFIKNKLFQLSLWKLIMIFTFYFNLEKFENISENEKINMNKKRKEIIDDIKFNMKNVLLNIYKMFVDGDEKILISILLLNFCIGSYFSGSVIDVVDFILKNIFLDLKNTNTEIPSYIIPFFKNLFYNFFEYEEFSLSASSSSSSSSTSSSSFGFCNIQFLYIVLILNVFDKLIYFNNGNLNYLFKFNLTENLKSVILSLRLLSEKHNLFIIHHSLFLIKTITDISKESFFFLDNLFKNDFISIFSPLIIRLNEIFSKSITSKKTLLILSSLSEIFNCLFSICFGDKSRFLKNENGVIINLINFICDIIKQISEPNTIIIEMERISIFFDYIIKFFDFCLRDKLPIEEMKKLINIIFGNIKKSSKFIIEFILNFLYHCIYYGIKEGNDENLFVDEDDNEKNYKNEELLNLFNYFTNDDDYKIMRIKLYCSLSFIFLNKNKIINKKYSIIIKFLEKCKKEKYSIIDEDDLKLTNIALDYLRVFDQK
jgi:uncharacterized protein YnzC (UPF0291/DUF896 family)